MNERKILPREIVTDDAAETGTEALGEMLRRLRQFLRSHIVRRRIDEIAGKRCGFCDSSNSRDVDAIGRYQPDVRCVRFAVAAESITAERKGEHGETRVVRRIGEAIDAWRQQTGQ